MAYTSASTDAALARLLNGGAGVHHWQSARRIWPDTRRLQLPFNDCCRLVLPCNAVHSIQQTEQIPNDPPRMGAKSTTPSNHPSTQNLGVGLYFFKISTNIMPKLLYCLQLSVYDHHYATKKAHMPIKPSRYQVILY